MSRKTQHIPVYGIPPGSSEGIMIMHQSFHGSMNMQEIERAHRDGGYTFIIQEKGWTRLEIDFQIYCLSAPAIIFIHPSQVHRVIEFASATISTWMITEENLRQEYLNPLNELMPAHSLTVAPEMRLLLSEAASLCLQLYEQKSEKLSRVILKDSCNALVGLVISQYLSQTRPASIPTRLEAVTKAFRKELEKNFRTVKGPAGYAGSLNITTSYLNECVKASTGKSVSYHIQQRIILEAKRLLYHSSRSVKEIAAELGYDDHSYFSRLFAKLAGMTPITFREKNRD